MDCNIRFGPSLVPSLVEDRPKSCNLCFLLNEDRSKNCKLYFILNQTMSHIRCHLISFFMNCVSGFIWISHKFSHIQTISCDCKKIKTIPSGVLAGRMSKLLWFKGLHYLKVVWHWKCSVHLCHNDCRRDLSGRLNDVKKIKKGIASGK